MLLYILRAKALIKILFICDHQYNLADHQIILFDSKLIAKAPIGF